MHDLSSRDLLRELFVPSVVSLPPQKLGPEEIYLSNFIDIPGRRTALQTRETRYLIASFPALFLREQLLLRVKSPCAHLRNLRWCLPPKYPLPTGSHSLDQTSPVWLYQRPFPDFGKPEGAETVGRKSVKSSCATERLAHIVRAANCQQEGRSPDAHSTTIIKATEGPACRVFTWWRK